MIFFLFALYLCIFSFLIVRIRFIRDSGIPVFYLIPLFFIKVLAGIMVGYLSALYQPGGSDYWNLQNSSVAETEWLLSNPGDFFSDLFRSYHTNGYLHFFGSHDSFWNDFRNNLLIKVLALLNLITHHNYYVNSLFFNFIGFFGHVTLFKIMCKLYPENKTAALLGSLLIPTTLFFSSGLHRDQLVFLFTTIFIFQLTKCLDDKWKKKQIISIIASLIFIGFFRSYMLIALLPGSFLFIWVRNKPKPNLLFFTGALLLLTIVTTVSMISNDINPLHVIVQKRADYLDLGRAATDLPKMNLLPNWTSFIQHFPQAINHVVLRPYFWETENLLHLATSLELYLSLIIIIAALWKSKKIRPRPIHLFMLMFCCTGLIFIGYVVPNFGSIIRYRSLYLPYIITPALAILLPARKHI